MSGQRLTLSFFSVILSISSLDASVTKEGFYFTSHDWEVACDNTLTCRAAGYPLQEQECQFSLLITRPAGNNETLTAEFTLSEFCEVDTKQAISLKINDKNWGELTVKDKDDDYWQLTEQQIQAIVKALKDNDLIIFQIDELALTLSNVGSKVIFLKIDDFQGRLDTSTAWIQSGNQTYVLAPQSLPRIQVAPVITPEQSIMIEEEQLQRFLEQTNIYISQEECDGDDADIRPGETPRMIILNETYALIEQLCWQSGYVIEGYNYWLVTYQNNKPKQLISRITDSGSSYKQGEIFVKSNYRRTIRPNYYSTEYWQWNGSDFILSEVYLTGQCRNAFNNGICRYGGRGLWKLITLVSNVENPNVNRACHNFF